jgi:hypothetical protein
MSNTENNRIIYYYQTQYYNNQYVSLAPVGTTTNPQTQKPYVTTVIVAAFHLGYTNNQPYIHLNDNTPDDSSFTQMWEEVATLQSLGITATMMLGGAAAGSYDALFDNWDTFYPILKSTIQQYGLNGIDLDVEQPVTLNNIEMLINQLSSDFGEDFIITLEPVAAALSGGGNLSGFDYMDLYNSSAGKSISWFNGQFYSGYGTLASPDDYESAINYGYPPNQVVAGMLSNPAEGYGFVDIATVQKTVSQLVAKYSDFGGVFAWEYFNALPGGLSNPIEWAVSMGKAIQPDS